MILKKSKERRHLFSLSPPVKPRPKGLRESEYLRDSRTFELACKLRFNVLQLVLVAILT